VISPKSKIVRVAKSFAIALGGKRGSRFSSLRSGVSISCQLGPPRDAVAMADRLSDLSDRLRIWT
jgi:hypothetical protein